MIHFGTDTNTLLELQRAAGGHIIGLDWRVELDAAWNRLGPGVGVQGNLDPVILFAPLDEVKRQVTRILDQAAGRPGHIFNLGHGILPTTPVATVKAVIDMVRAHRARFRAIARPFRLFLEHNDLENLGGNASRLCDDRIKLVR